MRVFLRLAAALTLGFVLAPLFGTPTLGAEEYRLGPQDRLRLKVFEWRASHDVIFEWSALNDDFTVGADGTLSLPFIGIVPAEGLPPGALGGIIAHRLAERMHLGQPPDVAVEIVQFRPFYVAGQVLSPGEFPYRPGLNVLEAITIAGGLRTRDDSMTRIEREMIAGDGEISLLTLTHTSLLARRARLQAEAEGAEALSFPSELAEAADRGTASMLMNQEREVFEARRNGFQTQLRAMTELRGFLERESESLDKQLGFLDEQIESVKEELVSVSKLVDQGLAVAPRQMALERSLLQVQSDRLSAETSLLRAKQEASRTDISILELKNTRTGDAANDLREVELQLSETARKTDTALLLLNETESVFPLLGLGREARRPEPIYTVVRPGANGATTIAATETTPLEPGDTLKVEVPLPTAGRDGTRPVGGDAGGERHPAGSG